MNFDPQLSVGTAIFMSLLAAALWGTWFISLKYLDGYPLDGFIVTLYGTSVVFVWLVGLLLEGGALPANIADVLAIDPMRIVITLVCGVIYVVGMRFSLMVIRSIGLSLMQPINSSLSILVGTFISAAVGGLPQGVSLDRLFLACLVLVGAVVASMLAGRFRSQRTAISPSDRKLVVTMSDMWRALGLILLSSLFVPAYPLALSFGLRSTTQSNGLAVLPFMALLSTGAFLGALMTSGVNLTRQKQWRCVLTAPFRIHKWGIMSGLFH